jgi:hypothetical protein
MTKPFNFKKKAQVPNPAAVADPFGAESPLGEGGEQGLAQEQDFMQQEDLMDDSPFDPLFATEEELNVALQQWGEFTVAWDELSPHVPADNQVTLDSGEIVNARETLNTGLKSYYENITAAHTQEEAVNLIFQVLPHPEEGEEADQVPGIYRKVSDMNYIKTSEEIIRRLAAEAAQVDNAFLWGPGEKRYDPFYRQPVSDWHVVERNKGFGLTIDDVWNIDWEALWRGNIMDKYSRPYRDKDGNWVGGYIQKRFEVDKWIPETSNMQLKPGERRKPRPAEYGVLESRLQDMRSKNERGYGPDTDTSLPFNWKNASGKQVKKALAPVLDRGMPAVLDDESDAAVEEAFGTPLPPDMQADIDTEIDQMYTSDPSLDNMSPVEFGKALYQQSRSDPTFDPSSIPMDDQVRSAYMGAMMADKLQGIHAKSHSETKQAQGMNTVVDWANSIVKRMDDHTRQKYKAMYGAGKWADAYQLLGESVDGMPGSTIRSIADSVNDILSSSTAPAGQLDMGLLTDAVGEEQAGGIGEAFGRVVASNKKKPKTARYPKKKVN